MTKVLTVRLSEAEFAECDAEAARMGLTRTDYVRLRLAKRPGEQGVDTPTTKRRFKSWHLIGSLADGSGSSNEVVRKAMKDHLEAKRARNR